VLTPNLDRMARQGITFHNAHMTSTVCTPSRYTCLTGRYAGSSYSPVYLEECPLGQQGLPAFNVALEDDNMNVGRVLADNGYATGLVGKYHVGLEPEGDELAEFGLHDIPKNVEFSEKMDRWFNENEKRYRELVKERGFTWAKNVYWNNIKEPWKGHNPEWTIDAALDFIDENKDGPFYLHYSTTLLHGPNAEWFRSLDKPLITGEGMLKEPLNVMPPRKTVMDKDQKKPD
jgi:arylsulfatase A-like enzyme